MLTGGCDISQEYLQQPVLDSSLIKDPEPDRDKWEFPVVRRALLQRMPIFAICRGHQVLNVALGGTLLLDIPGHALPEQKYGNIQELKYEPGAEIQIPLVNSSHHQAMHQLGEGLVVEARHASDGIIEQVRLRDYPFCLGVQYHPERDVIYKPLFEAFFEHIR
jgi:putative glutamine amidotransferase